jgi:hypothetical protein
MPSSEFESDAFRGCSCYGRSNAHSAIVSLLDLESVMNRGCWNTYQLTTLMRGNNDYIDPKRDCRPGSPPHFSGFHVMYAFFSNVMSLLCQICRFVWDMRAFEMG